MNHLEHGTHKAYNAGCRCTDCKAGHAAYARRQRTGTTRLVADVAPVRLHVDDLLHSGWTWRALADHAGVDRSSLYRQLAGAHTRMQGDFADRLMAISGKPRTARACIAEQTAARIEDTEFLLSVGEAPENIARRLDVELATLARLLARHGRRDLALSFEAAVNRQRAERIRARVA